MKLMPRDRRLDKCHIVYIGITRSGKTWRCIKDSLAPPFDFHKHSKVASIRYRTIFFDTNSTLKNHKYQKLLSDYAKVYNKSIMVTGSSSLFEKAWSDPKVKWIFFTPRLEDTKDTYRRKVSDITQFIRTSQASIPSREREPVYIYFDEISRLADKVKENAITEVFSMGGQFEIWGRAISQRPQMINRIFWDESIYNLFFRLKTDQWKALRASATYGINPTMEIIEDLWETTYQFPGDNQPRQCQFYMYDGHKWERGKVY